LLHDAEISPQKALREVQQGKLMRQFAVNTVGPALIAKYFVPPVAVTGPQCVRSALRPRWQHKR
jgi:hypothetical protein